MKLLLDTHAFVWWIRDDERLSARARRQIAAPRNEVYVSAVTAWELVVKESLRIGLATPVERTLPEQLARNGFTALPVSIAHALAVERLPRHHTDPFDRLLIAQAVAERLTIVSADRHFLEYPAKVVW